MKQRVFIITLFLLGTLAAFVPKPAVACCKCDKETETLMDKFWIDGYPLYFFVDPIIPKTLRHIEGEFTTQKQWLAGILWEDTVLPAMMMITDELVNVGMKQVEIFGQLLDAKTQLETQQVMQVEKADIHKRYSPSMGICEIGTGLKSLALSDRRADLHSTIINQRAQRRHLGSAYSSASTGKDSDKNSRLAQFKNKYCNKGDNKNGMELLCGKMTGITNAKQRNRDIDYVRMIDTPWTLNISLTDNSITQNEEDIFALASNLYGHDILRRPLAKFIRDDPNKPLTDIQETYMDARALMAKRSVAENSFNAIAGMKSTGGGASREYLVNMLSELGIDANEGLSPTDIKDNYAGQLLGDDPGDIPAGTSPLTRATPSYYAQMEILTKKMFQNPDFYKNLYDKPGNVDRKTVALQAIGLMQKFDIFKSYLRQESAVSVLLELAVMEMQEEIENDLNSARADGRLPTQ